MIFPVVTVAMYFVSFGGTELTTTMFVFWAEISYWFYLTAFWAPIVLMVTSWAINSNEVASDTMRSYFYVEVILGCATVIGQIQ
jgi:hypothetical protein